MRSLLILGGVLVLAVTPVAQAQEQAPAAAATAVPPEASVDPEAVEALKRMSAYLASLNTFKLVSTSAIDVITSDNQKVQMDSVTVYQVKKPGIAISYNSDMKQRQYLFDGKQFTVFAPAMGYYATVPAPATNREFLKELYEKTGIELPLEDLFRWADDDQSDINALTSAFSVGTAMIDGARTDHWAFRSNDFDWEVWIEQGDRPLPRKIVITDRTDPTLPSFSARLAWEVNPTLNDADFTYVPGPGAIAIQIASAAGAGQ